jgi:hypothetical protein
VGPLNRYGWWKRQDGAIRQQVIEQLMRQIMRRHSPASIEQLMREIMNYDAEFRREEATSAVSSNAKH